MPYKIGFSKSRMGLAILSSMWILYIVRLLIGPDWQYQIIIGTTAAAALYLFFSYLAYVYRKLTFKLNQEISNLPIEIIIGGMVGLLAGIIVAVLGSIPLSSMGKAGAYITIIFAISAVYLGMKIGLGKAGEVYQLFPLQGGFTPSPIIQAEPAKVLDTSAIIDGRIYDVCLSKFLRGPLIVPHFVIEELQHIADSSDNIRRNKGRRGLELLTKMQKHADIKIDIIDVTEPGIMEEKEVDSKLVKLCKYLNASIITNDYNLNKVAELQGITVLNINELTNAVKVIVYPGETMHIAIIKEGKEIGQGVGYLEDGTMVVVEDAQGEIGRDLEVLVTSVFQTAAGRMIFTRKIREDSRTAATQLLDMQEVNFYG